MSRHIQTIAQAIEQLRQADLTVHRARGGRNRVFERRNCQGGFRRPFTADELIGQARHERDMIARMRSKIGVSSWAELQTHTQALRRKVGPRRGDAVPPDSAAHDDHTMKGGDL